MITQTNRKFKEEILQVESKYMTWFVIILLLYYFFNAFENSNNYFKPYPLNPNNFTNWRYYIYFISIQTIQVIKLSLIVWVTYKMANEFNWVTISLLAGITFSLVYLYLLNGQFWAKEILDLFDWNGWGDAKTGIKGNYHPLRPDKEFRLIWFIAFFMHYIFDLITIVLCYRMSKAFFSKTVQYFTLTFLGLSIVSIVDFYLVNDQSQVIFIPYKLVAVVLAITLILASSTIRDRN